MNEEPKIEAETPGRPATEPTSKPFHCCTPEETLAALATSEGGLSSAEAEKRRARYGRNHLPAAERRSALVRFLHQFDNLLIYVLLAAAVVTVLLGHLADTGVIVAVVIVNALIGHIQEGRAEDALDAIRAMISPRATAWRNGRRVELDSSELVPGDIVFLEPGDRVPADCRLLRARNLQIDESMLTGESVTVDKSTASVPPETPLAERASMAYSGTMVTSGQARGIVVATGLYAEIGRLSTLVRRIQRVETPLLRQMNRFTRQLSIAILGTASGVSVFAVTVRGYEWSEAFLLMVGVVVAAIPEGLPAVMTITLAIGVRRMAARQAIVRRLPAVETLGSVSTICTDKTGTLTRNEMTVRSVITAERRFEVTGTGYEPRGAFRTGERDVDPAEYPLLRMLGLAGLLCSDATLRRTADDWFVDGDPMEGALLSLGSKMGIDPEIAHKQYPRNDEIPFDARHQFMATLHHSHDEGTFVFVKGAPERLLEMCSGQLQGSGSAVIDRDYWSVRIDELAGNGYRVLALATKDLPRGTQDLSFSDVTDSLLLIGVVGLIDPPRAEAIAAVEDCRHAGVKVMMITGDHPITAQAIALQLGLTGDAPAVTGQMLDSWSDTELRHQVATSTVFARTTPENKLRLVNALQADGAVVAMTGDGVNDAPALKRADVGIAMGRKGSEAAKDSAEIVLADDNFASIVAALREGRTVYDNLKKVIGWTLPTNVGEALALVMAVLLGWTLPLTPLQILWINMATGVTLGLTLAFEPTEPNTMRRPPRAPREPFLSGHLLWRIVFVGVLFVIGVFGMFFWALDRGLSLEAARTVVVNTMVVMEIFYLFSIRYVQGTSLTWRGVLGTPAVLLGVAAAVAAQFAFTYLAPMQAIFESRSLGLHEGVVIVTVGVALLLVVELEKYLSRRITRNIKALRYRHLA